MTDKQPEALRLAEKDEKLSGILRMEPTYAPELRRLHEVNAELVEALKDILSWEENEEMTWYPKARAALDKATGEQQ